MSYEDRTVGIGDEPLDAILFNPRNWRVHPLRQQDTLKGVLEKIGWVQRVIINKRTGNLVDGHLRCQLAARNGDKTIPVTYIDVSPEEELAILASLDLVSAMAVTDKDKLEQLIKEVPISFRNAQLATSVYVIPGGGQ